MQRFNLSKQAPTFVGFDGEVLEFFFIDGSKRLHAAFIQGIQVDPPNNKGMHMLTVKLKHEPLFLWADEDVIPKVNELIAEVQKAMDAHKI